MNKLGLAVKKNGSRPLLGAAAYLYNPTFLEIAALAGYQAVWIEMEHTFLSFSEAADLCRIASGLGLLTMIRIPDAQRATVLKAAECGPDIIDLPMANSPQVLEELRRYARFPPLGERGYFSVSRAVKYGVGVDVPATQQTINEELCLMVQVETEEAVRRIDELCAVPGIEGIFIGPADLSASLGVPGQTGHEKVRNAAAFAINRAKEHGKQTAAGIHLQDLGFWVTQDLDLLFCINDLAAMKAGAQKAFDEAQAALAQSAAERAGK
jgi:2-keto-3-deoxy-L-rhamnonate aldolase RhmA